MIRSLSGVLVLAVVCGSCFALEDCCSGVLKREKTPAFPGAEGFGARTRGGRGGKVMFVTNLKDYVPGEDPIPGSFRAACRAKGPRYVIFRVSGTISLKKWFSLDEPYITIAGQTAPGDGICLRNAHFDIRTHDVIIRHMRFRPGDDLPPERLKKLSKVRVLEYDAIRILNHRTNKHAARNIIIDHCSLSWSVDETISPGGDHVTVQWCIISEPLHASFHSQGPHGFGWNGLGATGSAHHNLLAHIYNRSPNIGAGDWRNNVVYNSRMGGYNKGPCKFNMVNNYYKPGPCGSSRKFRKTCFTAFHADSRIYIKGNYMEGAGGDRNCPQGQWKLIRGPGNDPTADKPYPTGGPITTHNVREAYTKVLKHAGATLPKRDAVDRRIVNDVKNNTGNPWLKSVKAVGGYPELKSTPAPKDTDNDGMPDEWEEKFALNPNDPSDSNMDKDNDGYMNIEEWFNGSDPARQAE